MNQPDQLEKEPQTQGWSHPSLLNISNIYSRECRFAFVASRSTWHRENWCDGILLLNVCAGQVKGGRCRAVPAA